MFKPFLILILILALLLSPSRAEEAAEFSTEVQLPRCRCICRTFPFMKRIVRRRCRRQAVLCRVRSCTRGGRRGIRCCIIFKLVADETGSGSTGVNDVVAAPYPPLGGSCGGTSIVHNFFCALLLSNGSSLTRVKIAFCVVSRDVGQGMFDEVFRDINARFRCEDVKDVDAARNIIRQEAVGADAFALAYYNPV